MLPPKHKEGISSRLLPENVFEIKRLSKGYAKGLRGAGVRGERASHLISYGVNGLFNT